MSFSLDNDSISRVLDNSDQVQVYGWDHCEYESLMEYMAENEDSPIKKLFTDSLGNLDESDEERTTLDGRIIEQVQIDQSGPRGPYRMDKAGLTNLIMENYKRRHEKLPLIPILFSIDISDNPYPTTPETICSKDPFLNGFRTHSELRRAYKLKEKFGDLVDETFRFVKLVKTEDRAYVVERIEAPWKSPEWDQYWTARKAKKIHLDKPDHWELQVTDKIAKYHLQRKDKLFQELTASPYPNSEPSTLFTDVI